MEEVDDIKKPIFRDIRRYFCDYCGICRSKKSLIAAHMLTHHKEEVDKARTDGDGDTGGLKASNTCPECGVSFKKPAYLKQHMQSHSLERPYRCSVEDCHSSYRRKDHLTRHLLQHQGKLFKCPIENCNCEFAIQGNMKRHVRQLHDEDRPPTSEKQYVCQEIGCGKVFRFASRLQKHEDSHVKLDSVEAFCSEPGCMKPFTNEQCLTCEICGTKQLRKNIKRHLRTHDTKDSTERVKCNYKGCDHTFSNKSNLQQHVKAVHLKRKPFACGFSGCSMRFSYKHVREKHEKTGAHVYIHGDFEETDEQFRSRPRGGRKRKYPTVEMLVRKRVTPPDQSKEGAEYLSWLAQEIQGDA
ncbi:transcription factor IIIA isoform X2 [Ziziphus jujuba]|uniref:Transcription factor IIIA isoform X2 n=1 Tax=Ziziphus jujuba TaxID=326968 RepID=A0ABM4A8Y0_ZIZJJ|nr:transcription factor IIIA isoform X2 [Ziziphus jujuba]